MSRKRRSARPRRTAPARQRLDGLAARRGGDAAASCPFSGSLRHLPREALLQLMEPAYEGTFEIHRQYARKLRPPEKLVEGPDLESLARFPSLRSLLARQHEATTAALAADKALSESHHQHLDRIESAWLRWADGGPWSLPEEPLPGLCPEFDPTRAAPSWAEPRALADDETIFHNTHELHGAHNEFVQSMGQLARKEKAAAQHASAPVPDDPMAGPLQTALDDTLLAHGLACAAVFQHLHDHLDWFGRRVAESETRHHSTGLWSEPTATLTLPNGVYW